MVVLREVCHMMYVTWSLHIFNFLSPLLSHIHIWHYYSTIVKIANNNITVLINWLLVVMLHCVTIIIVIITVLNVLYTTVWQTVPGPTLFSLLQFPLFPFLSSQTKQTRQMAAHTESASAGSFCQLKGSSTLRCHQVFAYSGNWWVWL